MGIYVNNLRALVKLQDASILSPSIVSLNFSIIVSFLIIQHHREPDLKPLSPLKIPGNVLLLYVLMLQLGDLIFQPYQLWYIMMLLALSTLLFTGRVERQ